MLNKISVIIPTKNRPHDLLGAVMSICQQARLPDELVIIDQSDTEKNMNVINSFMDQYKNIHLIYIYDPEILGLVDAKRVSVTHATGNILLFLEDDVLLEHDFIYEIEAGFINNHEMIGCCGVITNPPKTSFFYTTFFKIFHWGIFKDPRIDALDRSSRTSEVFIPSGMLSGGASAWQCSVFDSIFFDVANGFHMFEDIDFSSRVAKYFGPHLYINTRARLAHYCSPINRDLLGARERRKIRECFTYYKKRKDWPNATISFNWLLLGMLLESIFQSFSNISFKPIQGYFLGVRDGFAKKIIA
ncbi:COG1216 Predicted glycosyltransferases [Candidatus Methylopumilus universalis]|uniref:glycosyltransferase family 2 protein n=1 Tax=Candidatus Methylopumilus universalis TaxID=2588536 RepID=UPI003BEEED7D